MRRIRLKKLEIAGTIGLVLPFFTFGFIFLAVASSPNFSWLDNALSDLGVQRGITAILFNGALIIGGLFFIVFAIGLAPLSGNRIASQMGATIFTLACVALTGIGIFNESFSPTHYILSVAFFSLLPVAMLVLALNFWIAGKNRLSIFTFIMAAGAAIIWILELTLHYVSGVAIPELISGLFGAAWTIVLGYLMLKKGHTENKRP
jgi:hypothetical membrane protein